jgi:hypothetical protein
VTTPRFGNWIPTFLGGRIWPLDVRPEDIHIENIAHVLSRLHRFGATCDLTVAQHSVLISRQLEAEGHGVTEQMWGLLHDACEGIMGIDVPGPLKERLGIIEDGLRYSDKALIPLPYSLFENRANKTVAERFKLPWPMPACVKVADKLMLSTEANQFFPGLAPDDEWKSSRPYQMVIEVWDHADAKVNFLDRFRELEAKR